MEGLFGHLSGQLPVLAGHIGKNERYAGIVGVVQTGML